MKNNEIIKVLTNVENVIWEMEIFHEDKCFYTSWIRGIKNNLKIEEEYLLKGEFEGAMLHKSQADWDLYNLKTDLSQRWDIHLIIDEVDIPHKYKRKINKIIYNFIKNNKIDKKDINPLVEEYIKEIILFLQQSK